MELEIMFGRHNSVQTSPIKDLRSNMQRGLRFNPRVTAYDDEYDDSILYADFLRLHAAVRSLTKTANSKLNLLINGNPIKRDFCTVVKVYAIFLKIGEIDNGNLKI